MAASPRRIYRNLTNAQLLQLQALAFDREAFGTVTGLSGQQHTSQLQFTASDDQLFELNAELSARGLLTALPQKVYQTLNGTCNVPGIIV